MKRYLALSALAAVAPVAAAQSPACDDGGTQMQMNRCASDDLDKADAELNATYGDVLTSLKGQTIALQRVKEAQRLWIKLRDADLAAQFPLADDQNPQIHYGSLYLLEYASARTQLTRQRTAYLRRQFLAPSPDQR